MSDSILEKAWGHYISTVNFLMTGNPNSDKTTNGYFQPFNLATLLSYSDKENFTEYLLHNIADYVAPNFPVNENSTTEEDLKFAQSLEKVYGKFLDEFSKIVRDALSSRQIAIEELEGELKGLRLDKANIETQMSSGWVNYATLNHIDISDNDKKIIWLRETGWTRTLEAKIEEIRHKTIQINETIKEAIAPELRPLIDAKSYFDDPGYMIKLPTSPTFDNPNSTRYWSAFHIQRPLIDIEEFLQNDSIVNHTFDTTHDTYSRVETIWKVKAKAKWWKFSGGSSAERRKLEELSTKSHFSFKVSFNRFQEVKIHRGDWYQDVLFTTIGKKLKGYWGVLGILATIPYSVVFAKGTKIEVSLSDEFKSVVEKFFSGGGSFGFGPFSAGGNYRRDEKYMTFTKTSSGFSLEDGTKTIRILGACVQRPNWNNQEAQSYHNLDLKSQSITDIDNNLKKLFNEMD